VKKLILSAMLWLGVSAGAFAQGTLMLQNANHSGGGLVYFGAALANSPVNLEVFYGPLGSTLAQLEVGGPGFGDVVFDDTVDTSSPGLFFDPHMLTLTTPEPGGFGSSDPTLNVELAIAGWTGSGFADYQAALEGGAPLIGITAAWGNPTGGAGSPPVTGAGFVDWVGTNSLILLAPAPEPTTLAIGGLGVGALLLFRRRK
jgi:hypothetical protein